MNSTKIVIGELMNYFTGAVGRNHLRLTVTGSLIIIKSNALFLLAHGDTSRWRDPAV